MSGRQWDSIQCHLPSTLVTLPKGNWRQGRFSSKPSPDAPLARLSKWISYFLPCRDVIILTRGNIRKGTFTWLDSWSACTPTWPWKVQQHYPGRRRWQKWEASHCVHRQEAASRLGVGSAGRAQDPSVPLHLARLCLGRDPQPSSAVLPAENQEFKCMSPQGPFHIPTMIETSPCLGTLDPKYLVLSSILKRSF